MRRAALVFGMVAVVAAGASLHASPASSVGHVPRSAAPPQVVRWLALGDSYSSGEGIPGAAVGNPSLQGQDNCQRANGDGTDARAYAVVAVDQLQASPAAGLAFERPFFVACTGAISDDVNTQLGEMRAQVPTEFQQWDVVSMSFGGNNVLFADVIEDCLDVTDGWGLITYEGCSVSDERLRTRVDMLVGRAPLESTEFAGAMTLPMLYDRVATAVRPGGHVVVMGYPQLIEEPERWASWIQRRSLGCQGVLRDDVRMLRGVTGYLNEQIALAVQDASARWQANGVTFDFVDLATQVYETSDDSAGRHGLCAAEQWINGITLGVTSGDYRKERSFHPNQTGHLASGNHLAALVRDTFSFVPPAPPGPSCDERVIGADLGEATVEIVEGLCQDGWALLDLCIEAECGDSWVIARHDGSRWAIYTYFPNPLCRSEVIDAGAPLPIVDRINWVCETKTNPPPPETAPPDASASCPTEGEALALLQASGFPEIDAITIDYCDGELAVGGPSDFWVVWERTGGSWRLMFYTFSGSELCDILLSRNPNIGYGC